MSKPSNEPLQTIPVYSSLLDEDHATAIQIEYIYLLKNPGTQEPVDDPGRVGLILSDEDGAKAADMDVEEGRRIAHAINEACDLAEAAERAGAVPDRVPAEWTEDPA